MTHKELIVELAQRLNWTQSKVSDALDATVALMSEKLSENIQVSVPGFGIFETRKKSERISVNPLTRERFLVPPKIVATFKPAPDIKDRFKNAEAID